MSFQQNILYLPNEVHYIGLANYQQLFTDPVFWVALQNTLIWVVLSVFSQFILGFIGALVLNEKFRGRGLVRSVVILPWAIPGAVVGIIWGWLLDPNFGLIDDLLMKTGLIHHAIPWLSDTSTALLSIILANLWRGAPFFIIILLAGLQAIPNVLYEAARVDGASMWGRFIHITIPTLKPTIIISTVIRIIWTFNYPDLIFIMTNGGPANSTQILASYVLITAYELFNFGYAATLSVFTLILVLGFTIVYYKMLKGVKPGGE
jgi:multiple sugar transport system permease protein